MLQHAQRLAHVGVEFGLGDAGLLEVDDVKEVVAEVFLEFRSADLGPHGWHAEREHPVDALGVQQRDVPAQDPPKSWVTSVNVSRPSASAIPTASATSSLAA